MTDDIPFLKRGERLPVDVVGRDVEGAERRLDEFLAGHERVLLYFYPFDARDAPPEAWRRLERDERKLRDAGTTVVGVRGPALATRDAPLEDHPFPLLEDHNYALGQAVGVLGGGRGDDIQGAEPPRGLVLLDHEGRVLDARRGDDVGVLDEVLRAR